MACSCVQIIMVHLTATSSLFVLFQRRVSHAYLTSYAHHYVHWQVNKFVFINFSDLGESGLQEYHGKAVALDIKHHHAPYAAAFIIHEMRVRGFNPFQPTTVEVAPDLPWQNWILATDVYDFSNGVFKRDAGPDQFDAPGIAPPSAGPMPRELSTATTTAPSTRMIVIGPPDAQVIDNVLTSMHQMPTWRAGTLEGMSWEGTAEENVQKYITYAGS